MDKDKQLRRVHHRIGELESECDKIVEHLNLAVDNEYQFRCAKAKLEGLRKEIELLKELRNDLENDFAAKKAKKECK